VSINRIVIALALAGACTDASTPPVTTDTQRDERMLLTGQVHATDSVDIVGPVTDESSVAIRWIVADGSHVAAGDPIIAYEVAPFEQRLRDGKKQLQTADTQAKLARRAAKLQLAEKQFAVRTREIEVAKAKLRSNLPSDLVTKRAAQEAELTMTQATSDLEAARRELRTTREQNALADKVRELELAKLKSSIDSAERAITDLTVHAPRDGLVVLARQWHVADVVEEGQLVLSQPNLDRAMEVRASLIDVDDGRIAVGDSGTCTLVAYHEPMPCTVTAIWPLATATPGSLRRAFTVTLSLAGGTHVRPRMAVEVVL
jgi:multidrug resistance efflux pump